jgi:hypothetical protein
VSDWEPVGSLSSSDGVNTGSQTPLLVEEKGPFKNRLKFGKIKNMVMGPDEASNQEKLC